MAAEPNEPPDWVREVLLPEQIGEVEADNEVPATDAVFTEMLAVPVNDDAEHPFTSVIATNE